MSYIKPEPNVKLELMLLILALVSALVIFWSKDCHCELTGKLFKFNWCSFSLSLICFVVTVLYFFIKQQLKK